MASVTSDAFPTETEKVSGRAGSAIENIGTYVPSMENGHFQ